MTFGKRIIESLKRFATSCRKKEPPRRWFDAEVIADEGDEVLCWVTVVGDLRAQTAFEKLLFPGIPCRPGDEFRYQMYALGCIKPGRVRPMPRGRCQPRERLLAEELEAWDQASDEALEQVEGGDAQSKPSDTIRQAK
jgi:hypothetical protein